jgi:hypothetical protein
LLVTPMNYARRFRNNRTQGLVDLLSLCEVHPGPAAVGRIAWASQDFDVSSNVSREQIEPVNQIETEQP